ncbi:MAG: ABC transporter substrate-binding protein, partial [Mesorhizobium sp.]
MKLILAGVLAGLLAATAAKADEMVFTSWGGTTQEAQTKSWAEPFTANSGIKVLQDGPTDYGKLKAMVDAKNVTWDVVDVEMDFAIKAAKDGLLEPIDFAVVPKDALDPRFSNEHAVGSFYYSFVLAW